MIDRCAFPAIFDPTPPRPGAAATHPFLSNDPDATPPPPYVLQPADAVSDDPDGCIALGLTLFGPAQRRLPYALQALHRAGATGLTGRRVVLELIDVALEQYAGGAFRWEPRNRGSDTTRASDAVPPVPSAIRIRLLSPLRIRQRGRLVPPDGLDFRLFAANLLRRASLLSAYYGTAPMEASFASLLEGASRVAVVRRRLSWRDLHRYSTRQNTAMKMGGLTGSFEIAHPELEALWPLLWLGQWTHVGKGTTMGLGRYVLEPTNDQDQLHGPAPLNA